jgi:hypothetical protein
MIVVERFAYTPVGTFGRLYLPSGAILFTCEDPDRDNAKGMSCIPEGEYLCVPRKYNKGGYDAYHITGVLNRDLCLIHKGNSDEDVEGCIAVGMDFPCWLDGGKGLSIGRSADAFTKFMAEMSNQNFTLQVRGYVPSVNVAGKQKTIVLRKGETIQVQGA